MARSAWIQDRWSGSNGNGSKFSGKVGYPGTLGTLKSGQTFLIWVRFSMTSLITSVTSEWERFRSCLTSESLWSIDISPVPWWSLRRYVIEWQSIIHHVYPIGGVRVWCISYHILIHSNIATSLPFGKFWVRIPSFRTSTPGWIPHAVDVALSNVRNYTAWQEPLGDTEHHGQDMICCSIGMVIRLLIMINQYY